MTRRGWIVTTAVLALLAGIVLLPAVRESLATAYSLVTDRQWVQETVRSFGRAACLRRFRAPGTSTLCCFRKSSRALR